MLLFLASRLVFISFFLIPWSAFSLTPNSSYFKNIKPVVPIDEPLSYYGNPLSYKMDGKVYQVLRSSKGFHQEGLASWYGSDFHQKRTSSGEPYYMYAITAAHKTLPLPSYVRVTNLNNGRSIVVRVNDRGPFHCDRILDLSYAAARVLGFMQDGTAKVSIDAISMSNYEDPVGQYFLQVASLSKPSNAKKLKSRLEREFRWPVVMGRVMDLYTISVGPFENKNKLEQVRYQLAQIGFDEAFPVIR